MTVGCLDLEKAYDTVRRDKLLQVLEEYGIHGSLRGAVREFYKKREACVKIGDKMSRWFQITRGVRQGCAMSLWLFNVFMVKIVREAHACGTCPRISDFCKSSYYRLQKCHIPGGSVFSL